MDVCSLLNLHGLQGDLCSDVWGTSYSSFCIDFGVCGAVILPYSFLHLPAALFVPLNMLFPVKSVIPEVLLLSLMGSALASCGSILEPSGVGSLGHREASGSFNRSQPVAPLLPKHCLTNPVQEFMDLTPHLK